MMRAHPVFPALREDDDQLVKRAVVARRQCMLFGRCNECGAIYDYDNAILVSVRQSNGHTVAQLLAPIQHRFGCICRLPAVEMASYQAQEESYAGG